MATNGNQDQEVRLLTISDVERALSLSRSRIYELIGSGQLISVKVGRRRLVRREDLDSFIANLEESAA